jgi:hypothetical protein
MELQDPIEEHIVRNSMIDSQPNTSRLSKNARELLDQIAHIEANPRLEEIYEDTVVESETDLEQKHLHSKQIINSIMQIVPVVSKLRRKSFMENPIVSPRPKTVRKKKIETVVKTVVDVVKTAIDIKNCDIEQIVLQDIPNDIDDMQQLQKEYESLPADIKKSFATVKHWVSHKVFIINHRKRTGCDDLPFY